MTDDLPTSAPVEITPEAQNTEPQVSKASTLETEDKIINLSQDDYDDLVNQLEAAAAREEGREGEDVMLIFSKVFWDHLITKILVSLASVKIWILIFVLWVPVELVKKGFISGNNYTNILIIVAPLVVGMREFSKVAASKSTPEEGNGSKLINAIKQKFKV